MPRESGLNPLFDPNHLPSPSLSEHAPADVPESSGADSSSRVRLPAAVLVGHSDEEFAQAPNTAENLKVAYEGWLERRDIDLAQVPRLTIGEREYDIFRNAPSDYLGYVKKTYEIPDGDQDNCFYALIDVNPNDSSQPSEPKLVQVTEADFGTSIDTAQIAMDFKDENPDPGGPSAPERSGDAYITVDIGDALAASHQELSAIAKGVMKTQTADPFSTANGDIGVRAGGLSHGQKDAYIWTGTPITKSVELTLALPGRYDSVCVVRGTRREAANGKNGMAQIDNPEEVLKIEGEDLKALQDTYRRLYRQPYFAVTDLQRQERDQLFNDYDMNQISRAARANEAQQAYNRQLQYQRQSPLRAREIPR